MSWVAQAAVWRLSKSRGVAKFVLLGIAQYANEDAESWPRQATLATRLGLSERAVREHVRALEKLGELATFRDGRGVNRYRIMLDGASEGPAPNASPELGPEESSTEPSSGAEAGAAPDRKLAPLHRTKALESQDLEPVEIAGAEDQAPADEVGVDESVGVVGAAPDHELSTPTQTSGEPGEDRPEGVREAGSSGSAAHDETTTTQTEPEHRQPTKSTVPRPIFDAILDGFVAMMRRRPATDAEWSRWHKPAEEIGKAMLLDTPTAAEPEAVAVLADFAFREIQRRANLFRRVYDFARLTPTALGAHWGELGPPVAAPTRGEDADPEPVESDLCEHGNPWGDCEKCAEARREALKGFAGGIGGAHPRGTGGVEPPSREEQLAKGRKLLEETGTSVMDQIAGGEETE